MELSGLGMYRASGGTAAVGASVRVVMLAAFTAMIIGAESARMVMPASLGRSAGAQAGSWSHVFPIGATVSWGVDGAR